MSELYIYGTASIFKGELIYDGKNVFKAKSGNLETFLSKAYEVIGQAYPKFFKMDNLGKLAFIASELLLSKLNWINDLEKETVAICLQTAHGSTDTDLRYQQTISQVDDYFPSPALFVYTLPNIAIGEICIRNGFKGENLCLISEQFDIEQAKVHVSDWLTATSTKVCLIGWLDVNKDDYKAILVAIGINQQKSCATFSAENIK